jgi:hypothetical protein
MSEGRGKMYDVRRKKSDGREMINIWLKVWRFQ